MSKRRKNNNDNRNSFKTETLTIQLRRFNRFAEFQHVYYGIPIKNGRPAGAAIRFKFNNIIAPDTINDQVSWNANNKQIIVQYKLYKNTNSVVLWRFEDDETHRSACCLSDYRLSYYYRFKGDAIRAFEEYNELIHLHENWIRGKISALSLSSIENDPWYLIEWEKSIHDLGLPKDTKKYFTLAQCDVIGISLGLDPLTPSRVLQYCIESMKELCYKYGSTIVYFEPYIKYTIENINESEFNVITRTIVSRNQIVDISKERKKYFFIGRTEMHNLKLFIASKELWDAQQYIIDTVHKLTYPMNTPYYAERELLINYVKGKDPIRKLGFDVVKNILSKQLWFNHEIDHHVEEFMELLDIEYIDDIQRKAIHSSINERVNIVSGGPGRGKSACVLKGTLHVLNRIYNIPHFSSNEDVYHFGYGEIAGKATDYTGVENILDTLKELQSKPVTAVHILSFTGKAVSRIKEVMFPEDLFGLFEPMTIHRLLARLGKFRWLTKLPTILVIDEVSMVSDILLHTLIKRFSSISKIIVLGDIDQLPPIQPGNLLKEFVESRCLPVTRLVKNYRQGAGSGLPDVADKIIGRERKGQGKSRIYGGWDHALNVPTQKKKDFATDISSIFGGTTDCEVFEYDKYHDENDIFNDIVEKVVELRDICNLFKDCVVLTARRIEFAQLNAKLQSAFMPDLEETLQTSDNISHFYEGVKYTFVPGDRVMYLENDYNQEIFNGDVGIAVGINKQNKELKLKLSQHSPEKKASLDDCQPAWSFTVHKAQGSEYNIVIIYISNAAQLLHVDQWLYTAFTRAKKKVYIFGYTNEIVNSVVREMKHRRTFLKHRLQLDFSYQLNDLLSDDLQDVPA